MPTSPDMTEPVETLDPAGYSGDTPVSGNNGGPGWLWVALIVLVVMAVGGGVAFFIIKKKEKAQDNNISREE